MDDALKVLDARRVDVGLTAAVAYLKARDKLAPVVAEAVENAWASPPISEPAEMVLGRWGPGATIRETIDPLEQAIRKRTKSIWRR